MVPIVPREEISRSLETNIQEIKRRFGEDGTLLQRRFAPAKHGGSGLECCLFCIDGMVNSALINDNIIRPVVLLETPVPQDVDPALFLERQVMQTNEIRRVSKFSELMPRLLYGDTVVFCQGSGYALVIGSKGFVKRSVTEPPNEPYLKGPREGFTEPLLHNLAMLRRKLRTETLRYEYFSLGETSGTACCLCYLEDVVDRRALAELRLRLSKVRIDGILDSNYVAELISDSHLAPIRTTGTTERPDVVAAKLLEGRIAILVDGSPVVVTVPHILLELFQAGEDYYVSYAFAGINRILRIIGFFLSISVAPIYLALVGYHQELLPLPLLLSISQATQGVPFPAMIEVLLLIFQFEVLREAGSRTTSSLGQTLSVVGGLVIGQAAVEAKMVAAPTLIVVAFSGITGLIAPKLKSAVFLSRLLLIILANFYGIYGYFIGLVLLLAWVSRLQSFGVPMLSGLPLSRKGTGEDSYLRPPFRKMKKFGRFLAGWGRNRT